MEMLTRVPKIAFVFGIISLIAAVGCGTGGGSPVLIHGSGNFSTATLNGSYVYQIHGALVDNQGVLVPYREVGVFTADGSGNITGGTDDSNFSATGTAITGSYSINSNGIGTITFNTSSVGVALNFGITVVGSSQVQMIEGDAGFTAAGTAILQDSSAAGTTPTGTFVFRLHQVNSANNPSDEASQVGAFSLSSGGAGAMDQNLNGNFTTDSITVALNAPTGGRGTGTLNDTTAGFVTDFVYYMVNSGTLALLVDNGGSVGSGSAEAQSGDVTAGVSGSYAFGSRGDDLSSIDGVATVGQFTATAGSITGTEDINQDLTFTANQNFSACYSSGSAGGINGRVSVVANGSAPCTATPTQVFWMVSPNRAFFVDNSGSTFEDGTADLQTVNSFSASTFNGQFSLLMDGFDFADQQPLSRVGATQFDGSGKMNLSEDVNGILSGPNQATLTGTYMASGNGRVVGTMSSNNGPLDVVMYAVSGSQAYVLQGDSGFVTSGMVLLQQ